MKQQKPRAVIFDLDGTLLDTAQDIGAGANLALHRSGFPEHPLQAYLPLIGYGIRSLLRSACPEGITDAQFEPVAQFYLSYYPEHCTERTVFFPGVPELIQALSARGIPLGILSNKTEPILLKICAHYFPEAPFRFIRGNNGVRPLKPAREAGDDLCARLALAPEAIAFVGDGETDMRFGHAMGFRTIGVSWGYRSEAQLREAGADAVAHSAAELLTLLS